MREAHPGENYPAHRDFAQKVRHAQDFVRIFGVRRPVLVDDLDGPLHRAFGTLPNMTYVISESGRVLFRSNWTDAHTLQIALDYLLHERAERRKRVRVLPFYAELLGHRVQDREAFFAGLRRAGERAVTEFIAAEQKSRG